MAHTSSNKRVTRTGGEHDALIAEALAADPDLFLQKVSSRIIAAGMNGCTQWTGGSNGSGVPAVSLGRLKTQVRRVMFVARGINPGDARIFTTCGTPGCVTLAHLRAEIVP
jgi:hypothetical protein